MSRRASLLAKQEKRKPRVRFPDELVFLDNIKDNDIQACHSMLRRASVQLDLNGLDSNGCTPLHNAVLEGNLGAVQLLVQHGADINRQDVDTWTPLHAACANGEADIARYLLSKGANKDIKTADGERPLDLCDARDFSVISVMLESDTARRARMLSAPDEGLEDDDDEHHSGSDHNDNDDEENNNRSSDDNLDDDNDKSAEVQYRRGRCGVKRDDNSTQNANTTTALVKGISNLKTNRSTTSSSSSRRGTSSTSPSKATTSPARSAHKSPTSRSTLNKSPSSLPGARKSPGVSPNTARKNLTDPPAPKSVPTSSQSHTTGSGRAQQSHANAGSTKTAKPQGHSILKKTAQPCHTVAE